MSAADGGARTGVASDAREAIRTRMTHLDILEAESIFIMREVAATFERPVLGVVLDHSRDIQAAFGVEGPGHVGDGHDPVSVLGGDPGRPGTDVAESLDRHGGFTGIPACIARSALSHSFSACSSKFSSPLSRPCCSSASHRPARAFA